MDEHGYMHPLAGQHHFQARATMLPAPDVGCKSRPAPHMASMLQHHAQVPPAPRERATCCDLDGGIVALALEVCSASQRCCTRARPCSVQCRGLREGRARWLVRVARRGGVHLPMSGRSTWPRRRSRIVIMTKSFLLCYGPSSAGRQGAGETGGPDTASAASSADAQTGSGTAMCRADLKRGSRSTARGLEVHEVLGIEKFGKAAEPGGCASPTVSIVVWRGRSR